MSQRFHGLYFACFFAAVHAYGQLPVAGTTAPVQHSISLDVKPVASGGSGSAANDTKTDTGKYTGVGGAPLTTTTLENKSTLTHHTVLAIAIRNFSPQPDQIQLEYYFFAQPVGFGKEYVLNNDISKISLQGGETQTVTAISKEVATTKVQKIAGADGYMPIMTQRETGDKLKGWLVRVVADGKVVQLKGSDSKWEDLGRDDRKLGALKKGPGK